MTQRSWAQWRAEYAGGGLSEPDLPAEPDVQLAGWLTQAGLAGLTEPNAMVLSTVSADGTPSSRLVLLKGLDADGLVFYTNFGSRKGRELEANPRCSLLFPWHALHRQVRVDGVAHRLDARASDAYFATRPRGAQLGAWASQQSSVVADRAALEAAYARAEERWPEPDPVPRPDHWGGFRVYPEAMEFWQGRPDRMHDRLRYRRIGDGWVVERLAP